MIKIGKIKTGKIYTRQGFSHYLIKYHIVVGYSIFWAECHWDKNRHSACQYMFIAD